MGDNKVGLSIPFVYYLGENLPTSDEICTLENVEDEVRLEIENGIINSVDVLVTLLEYNNDWNLLIKVVKKIYSLELDVEEVLIVRDGLAEANITQTYDAVVKFIEWYNQQN